MSITPEETIKILTAKAECMRREISGIDIDCNYRNCDLCDLCYKQGTTGDQMEALRVAISALQTQDVNDTNVGDTVSRQAAIDALCKRCDLVNDDTCGEKCIDIKILEKLPSAQPEIIRCKDCEYGEQDDVGRWFCNDLGCQIGSEDGSGYCANAERRTDG